jgi:hypothetical protein
MGATWEKEVALAHSPQYTYCPSIRLLGSHVDVAYADRQSGQYDIYHLPSSDFGTTWDAAKQISNLPTSEVYPVCLRAGSNVHLAWSNQKEIAYVYSSDGGATWEAVSTLTDKGSFPFLAAQGEVLHVLFTSQRDGHGAIYYKRNPMGNKACQASK